MQETENTLLLRFAGPLQAWGSSSRFNVRMSEREPTKSAVIGLLAAALGRRREEQIDDLAAVKFGVRIDQPGKILSDFHTAHTLGNRQSFVSNRHYVADAIFLVGIEGEEGLLSKLDSALRNPAFPLFLGRRSCPPSGIVSLGIREGASLMDALSQEPWLASEWYRKKQRKTVLLEIVMDAEFDAKGAFLRNDNPVSFDQTYRKYRSRSVISTIAAVSIDNPAGTTIHDAMEAI